MGCLVGIEIFYKLFSLLPQRFAGFLSMRVKKLLTNYLNVDTLESWKGNTAH